MNKSKSFESLFFGFSFIPAVVRAFFAGVFLVLGLDGNIVGWVLFVTHFVLCALNIKDTSKAFRIAEKGADQEED